MDAEDRDFGHALHRGQGCQLAGELWHIELVVIGLGTENLLGHTSKILKMEN